MPTMTNHDIEQKSPEWFALRLKYPLTASKAYPISSGGKGLETLVWEKISEKYSIEDKERYTNKDIDRGIELEPLARSIYELKTGNKVLEVGFVTNEKISKVGGASPDGLVREDGLIEIKSFEDKKHFRATIEGIEIEKAYEWQIQMQMLFTGRKWCDFVAYNPNFKKSLLIQRVEADIEMQEKIKEGLKKGEEIINNIEKQNENS